MRQHGDLHTDGTFTKGGGGAMIGIGIGLLGT